MLFHQVGPATPYRYAPEGLKLPDLRRYSHFFSTLYDEKGPAPGPQIGRGTHYSILRAVLWRKNDTVFHDFAVLWDEDHDERVIWAAEQLLVRRMLDRVLFIGERKGGLGLLVTDADKDYTHAVECLAEEGEDTWCATTTEYPDNGDVINDSNQVTAPYLEHIRTKWSLGTKQPTPVVHDHESGGKTNLVVAKHPAL